MKHHFLRRTGALLLALVLAFSLAAFAAEGGENQDQDPPTSTLIPVTSMTMSDPSITLKKGDMTQLFATVQPEDATNKGVSWRSEDPSIVYVNTDGYIQAMKGGSTTITAVSKANAGIKATCDVTVIELVTSVTLSQKTLALTERDSATLTAVVGDESASNKTLTWTSSDSAVVSVSTTGEVRALKPTESGKTVTITATANDGSGKYAECTVTVTARTPIPVKSVILDESSLSLAPDDKVKLNATVEPDDADNKSLTWDSNNKSVATVSGDGTVTAVAAGTATITATAEDSSGKDATCTVTVTSVSLNKTSITLTEGNSEILTATPDPANQTVTWTSSNKNVATVENGTVTAVGGGTAIITATAGKASATCEVTVNAVGVTFNASSKKFELEVGETHNLSFTVVPSDEPVSFESSDESIATVGTNGLVTAKDKGIAYITISAKDGKYTDTCKVTVVKNVPVTSVAIQMDKTELYVGDKEPITVSILPADATDKTVEWTSSNPSIAAVSTARDGTFTVDAKKAGEAKITATASGVPSATLTITVKAKPVVNVEKVELDAAELTLPLKSTKTLTATISPETATDQTVSWSSSNRKVVTVTQSGLSCILNPIAKGEATITVTTRDGEKTAVCIATVVDPLPADIDKVTLNRGTQRFDSLTGNYALVATVSPDNAKDKTIVWTSSDEAVATVDDKGVVKPVGPGEATITATSAVDSSKSATCVVTVSGIRIFTSDGTRIVADTTVDLTLNKTMELSYKAYGAAEGASITWNSTDNSIAYMVNGRINARAVGSASVSASTGDKSYTSPACTVRVSESTANIITGNVDAGVPYDFASILANLNNICREMTTNGNDLKYITNLSVLPEQGVLYYNYVSSGDTGSGVGGTERYYYTETTGERSLSAITFVPKSTYNGTATITYTGYSTNNETFNGIIRLTVKGLDDVTYETQKGSAVIFEAADFNNICKIRTGRELSYITLDLPLSSRGTLYYSYSGQAVYTEKITTGTQYFRTRTPYIEEIAFVPAEGFTGTVQFNYRAVDTSGGAYSGRVTINVTDRGSASVGDVVYQASQGARVTFKSSDFNTACQNAIKETLSYVRFELPSSNQGTLYYKYTNSSSYDSKVTASTRYYRTGTTNPISSVSFVPASNTLGNVAIKFTAYGTGGNRYEGTVTIQYPGGDFDGKIPYTTRAGVAVQFDAADFNELCQNVTSKNLNYVVFDDLPASNRGTLYYNYTTSGNGSRVSTSTRCYRSRTPSLSNVAFIPSSSYTGAVEIGFTATDESGTSFKGTVVVTVEEGNQTIKMNVRSGGSESFSVSDFNRACQDVTGSTLNYVRFDLPASSRGTLQYRYGLSNSSKVSSSTSYYRTGSSRLLEDVSFVAAANFDGVVEFEYTGYATNGQQFNGKVEVTVYVPTASAIRYTGDYLPISLLASDFDLATSQALTETLSYVQFTSLPGTAAGQLYSGYNGYNTGTAVSSNTRYYYNGTPSLNQLTFVPRAGYTGTASIGYTAVDTSGNRVTGTVTVSISSNTSSHFTDMSNYSWAAPSVEFLYQSGVVNGISNTQFGPGQSILRRDFVVILCRAFGFNTGSTSSFSDVPANSYYAQAIATAKDLGIVTGNGGLFMPDSALSRQDAMVMLQRALVADGQTVPSGASLSAYSDSSQISDYARSAVGSMVALGLVQGNNAGQLTPRNPVSRAEMAVIMHRLMTQ